MSGETGRFGLKACLGKGMVLGVLALLATVAAGAQAAGPADGTTPLLPAPRLDTDFLPPDQAFRLNVAAEAHDRLRLSWGIAPGYYLYRARLKFSTTTPNVTLGQADLPPGDSKHDEYFGEQVVYHAGLIVRLPVASSATWSGPLALSVSYQGCAEAGLCYPPITKTFTITMPRLAAVDVAPGSASSAGPGGAGSGSEQDGLAQLILGGSMWLVLAKFFGLGLLMAFTPCVLPMVPILSGLIAGQGRHATPARSFALSLAYVLGMATTYTLAGALTAALGLQVQALFQQTWIILLFAAMFVAMALSMFGLYSVQMPATIQTRLAATSNRQRAGTYGGVAVMGALSALIVTTCVAPPLVATLAVIGQSGDVVRGASALFAMSLGMGAPLLVVGASAGRLLPRAGAWMDTVKQLFGALMLGVAAWMLARLVTERIALLLYAVPLLAAAVVLWRTRSRTALRLLPRASAIVAGSFAATLCFGAWLGASDPLHPLTRPAATSARALQFRAVATLADLDRAVQAAAASGRAVMLDFYADWCVSCKEMERNTFSDPQVVRALEQLILLRADVTANSAADQALLQRFGIYGPPTIAFYDRAGHEQSAFRVVGYMKPASFTQLLSRLRLPAVAAVVPGG